MQNIMAEIESPALQEPHMERRLSRCKSSSLKASLVTLLQYTLALSPALARALGRAVLALWPGFTEA